MREVRSIGGLALVVIGLAGAVLCVSGCDARSHAVAASVTQPVDGSPAAASAHSPAGGSGDDSPGSASGRAAAAMASGDDRSASAKATPAAEFTTTGPLVAEQQADIAAERDGRVVWIAVELGDRVAKGQLLAALDDRALAAAVTSRTAKLASLRAQVREWEAEEKMDGADLRRADQMLADRILSQEGWEHVKYKLDEVVAEVARYRADESAAEADLSAAKLELEQSRIVAPFAGVVGRESLRQAQEVKKGEVLFWVTAIAPLRVLFTVPEAVMSEYALGRSLDLTTPAVPGLHQRATVLRVSPAVDPASGSVQVVGALVHASPLLKPGMSMQIAVLSYDAAIAQSASFAAAETAQTSKPAKSAKFTKTAATGSPAR